MDRTKRQNVPVSFRKTTRTDKRHAATSIKAGLSYPLGYIPLLPGDQLNTTKIAAMVEGMETPQNIYNAIHARLEAYFVPMTALERFESGEQVDRAFMKVKERDTDAAPKPFFETFTVGTHGANELMVAMGMHGNPSQQLNRTPFEAYNAIQNFKRQQVSEVLPLRAEDDMTLAEAFWIQDRFRHLVPDFDQAMIAGTVPLDLVAGDLPVRGIGSTATSNKSAFGAVYKETTGDRSFDYEVSSASGPILFETDSTGRPQIFAEMAAANIDISLEGMKRATKLVSFARLRDRLKGNDDYVIDLLMRGLRVPEQAQRNPLLLGAVSVPLNQRQRWATDGANLDKSASNAMQVLEMTLRLPPTDRGGVVIYQMEITPEPIYERKKDVYLYTTDPDQLPNALRDELDPEKVEVVPNDYVDTSHSNPNGVFGYAPLNHAWNRDFFHAGGKFYRPEIDPAFDEDRQRFWAVETEDPSLSADFHLCTNMHSKVFALPEEDSFELFINHLGTITGNTVMGPAVDESLGSYEQIEADTDQPLITKP